MWLITYEKKNSFIQFQQASLGSTIIYLYYYYQSRKRHSNSCRNKNILCEITLHLLIHRSAYTSIVPIFEIGIKLGFENMYI